MNKRGDGLAPRFPFWDFATVVCGVSERDAKVQLTAGQRAIWKSYDRRVALTDAEAEAYRKMTNKELWEAGDKAPPFLLLALSRGAGKSLLLATIAVYEAVTNSYRAAPGETVAVVALAPRKKQAKDMIGYSKAHLNRPGLAPFVAKMPEEEVVLKNGRCIRIQAVDTSGGAARGPTYITALFDESAFLGFDGKIVDADQWKAIIAGARGVSDFHGVLSSTPNGEQGFFFETFDANHGETGSAWEVFHGPQPVVRPEMSAELLIEYERADEEAFKREFLVDFKAGTGVEKFFNKHEVEACVQLGIIEVPYRGPTVQYVCAVDPTGGSHDLMTMTIVERLEDGQVRQCLARGWDPKEPNAPTVHQIAKEIAELVAPYGITTVFGDVFGGAWVTEAFEAEGLEYETRGFNASQKVQRASLLRELFAARQIELLDEPIQTRELREYEKKTLSSGAVSVNHPMTKLGSDDFLDSLALATWELVGHDVKLHPPEPLVEYNERTHNKKMYGSEHYPEVMGHGPVLTYKKIMERGEGPRWVLKNWNLDWRYAQCSVGELAWLCGVGPIPMVNVLGRDTVLQLTWMRWILSYWCGSHLDQREWILKQPIQFPAIPAWTEIRDRVAESQDVVTYKPDVDTDCSTGDMPSDWQPYAAKSRKPNKGVSTQPVLRPWVEPRKTWGLDGVIKAYDDWWPPSAWAGEIERIFSEGNIASRENEYSKDW